MKEEENEIEKYAGDDSQLLKRKSAIEMRKNIWDLRQKLFTYEAIAEKLGITASTVDQTLRNITKDYRKRHIEDVDHVKSEQVAEHEHIAHEAYQAWERSKHSYLQTKKKYIVINGQTTGSVEHNDTPIVNHGDPRYLDMAMKAKEAIRKIIGADAAIKIENKFSSMSDDELRRLALGEDEPDTAPCDDGVGGEERAEGE